MTEWTPGEWLYRPNEFDDWGEVRVRVPGSEWPRMVARAYDPRVEPESLDDYRRTKTDPYEANARLIAAAPTLYAALEAAIKIADEAREEWDKAPAGMRAGKILIALSGGCPRYRADIDQIHAALRAARGEPEDG